MLFMETESYPKVYLYRRIVQAKLFIDLHYMECIDVSNISDESYFSKFHFIRLFKKIYGKTPHQYLISVRVEQAKTFFKLNMPVSEVCQAVGFESPSSFSGLFKRIVGMSPSAFMEKEELVRRQKQHSPLSFVPGCFAEKNGWK